jgi:hypothetical protein
VLGLIGGACGGTSIGAVEDGGVGPDSAGDPPDAAPGQDAGANPVWGTIVLDHEVNRGSYAYETASLRAAFYEVDYLLPDTPPPDSFLETRTTPDGVDCDLYFSSPYMPAPPLPPEPEQVDAGDIYVESPEDDSDVLWTRWDGTGYQADVRRSGDADFPIPPWLVQEPLMVNVTAAGNVRLEAFSLLQDVVALLQILAPAPEETTFPDAGGNFTIRWTAVGRDQVRVRLDCNMDWDDAAFLCYPPAGQGSLQLPQQWLMDYSWGGCELRVSHREDLPFVFPGAYVTLRLKRTDRFYAHFDIGW